MANSNDEQLIVGLDIGTSKVVTIVGLAGPGGTLEIVGTGLHPSSGLKKGVVVNIESTVHSIQRAIEEAELMAGCHIHSVYVAIPADQEILHVLPQEFIIDNQEGVREPLGMSGVRLEAKVHLVTCAANAAQNIKKCIRRCGLDVDDIILEQLASSYAVLTEDEKQLGVCLVDIGGGTTDIAIFTDGAIRHTGVIPIAGDQVTNDIAHALRTPTAHAEELKVKYACALAKLTGPDETVKVPSVGDRAPRDLSRQALAEVVEPRYDELFTLVQAELRRSGFEDLVAAGVVLTGGTSKMEGVIELAEEIFHMPVRVGSPHNIKGLADIVDNPIYSTGVGLLLYGLQQQQDGTRPVRRRESVKESFIARLKSWFQGNL